MNNLYGGQNFTWWVGVVEDRQDPEKLGRCKVRIFGYHIDDLTVLPKADLPWAIPMQPITSAATSGIGIAPVGPVEGTWVFGWFLDNEEGQQPVMMGTLAGKNEKHPNADKKIAQDQLAANNLLTTSSGNPVTDISGNPIQTGTAVADSNYDQNSSFLNHPNNPKAASSGPLNNPSDVKAKAFKDPNGVYPKIEYSEKPDTNKLAAEDKSHKYFAVKTKNRKTSIAKAQSTGTWDEPESAYNALYPYNQVIETEAGHVIELDSSPNAERIHIYHKKGSYIEIDVNGSSVKKTIGDSYELTDKNGYVYVKGAYNLTVGGTTKILVQNDADIEVDGEASILTHRSALVQAAQTVQIVGDDIKVSGKSSVQITSDGPVNIQGSSITLNAKTGAFAAKAAKEVALQAGTTASVKGGLELLLDAATVKTKMGAIQVSSTKLPVPTPPEVKSPTPVIIKDSVRPDSPESIFLGDSLDKSAETFTAARIKNNEISTNLEDLTTLSRDTNTEKSSAITGGVQPTPVDVSEFAGLKTFPDSMKLSKYFTLGDLSTRTAATSYAVKDQNGLTAAQIVGNLKHLSVNVLDKIKEQYPDMIITSGFRSKNEGSDHDKGQAVDIQFTGRSNDDYYDIAKWIEANTPYKQVLLEYAKKPNGKIVAWIHVAAASNGSKSAMPIGTLVNHSANAPGARNSFVNYG
jgi:hypothetical protein